MHTSHREPLLLLLLAPTALAFSLLDVQEITGFGTACTNAYSTPFTSCTSNDFYGDEGCSTACADSLAALLAKIDESCNGHAASPSSLIGLIFSGNAFQTLCPGATGSAGGSGSPVGGAGSNNGNEKSSAHLSLPTNGVASPTSASLDLTSTSSFGLHSYLTPILATPSTTLQPLASSTLTPASTTITTTASLPTVSSTTLQISTPTSTSTVPLSDLTRVPTTTTAAAATSASSSSTSQQTSQGSNPQGAGGGTPFDITSAASSRNRINSWCTVVFLPTAIFVLLWLV